jgi:hypothetical protein
MQAIKILSPVNLTSGLSIPSGSVCVIAEGYADVKSQKDGVIPAQICNLCFCIVLKHWHKAKHRFKALKILTPHSAV